LPLHKVVNRDLPGLGRWIGMSFLLFSPSNPAITVSDTTENRKENLHLIRYVLAWVQMPLIEIANGALRQWTFAKVMCKS
jgi:hypothetical protein